MPRQIDFTNPDQTRAMAERFASRGLSSTLLTITLAAHHASDEASDAAMSAYENTLSRQDCVEM